MQASTEDFQSEVEEKEREKEREEFHRIRKENMEGVDEIMRNRVKRQARIVRVRRLNDHNFQELN